MRSKIYNKPKKKMKKIYSKGNVLVKVVRAKHSSTWDGGGVGGENIQTNNFFDKGHISTTTPVGKRVNFNFKSYRSSVDSIQKCPKSPEVIPKTLLPTIPQEIPSKSLHLVPRCRKISMSDVEQHCSWGFDNFPFSYFRSI